MAFKLPEPITVEGTTFTFERATHTHPWATRRNGKNYDWASIVERQPSGIHHDRWYFKGAGYSSQTSTRIGLCPHPTLGNGFEIPDDWTIVLTKRVADIKADKIASAIRRRNIAMDSQTHALYEVAKELVEWSKKQTEVTHGCPVQRAQDILDAIEVKANEPLQRSLSW